jgi:hypothetical protein
LQSASVLRLPVATRVGARRPRVAEGWAWFAGSLALYLAVAVDLVLVRHAVLADALSRVAGGYFALYSRDPHLAAIGFVRMPLPSLLMLPLLPFKGIFPALTQAGFAANIISALFMAGAVVQVHGILTDAHVERRLRLALTVLFALQPMLIYTGANGSSEAILLFFLLVAVRSLGQWFAQRELQSLVLAGFALAGAYLTGPEALPAAAGALLLVGVMSYRRARADRAWAAACDAAILIGPLAAAVMAWIGATWLITGDPLHQLSSVYGTGSEIQALRAPGLDLGRDLPRAFASLWRLLSLAPGLPVALGLGVFALRQRRDPILAVALGLLVPVVAVMLIAQSAGLVLLSLDGLIVAVPLTALAAGVGAVSIAGQGRRISGALAVIPLLIALPAAVALVVLTNGALNRSEAVATATSVSRYLDGRHLPAGSVMLDSFTGFAIVLESENPHQFLITNDRDFRLALTDPSGSGVQYLLVPSPGDPAALTSLDALNRTYPALFKTGGGMATFVQEFEGGPGAASWRLYRLNTN